MAEVLRVVTVDPNEETRQALQRALLSDENISLEAECNIYDVLPDVVREYQPDIAIVAIDSDPFEAMQIIQTVAFGQPPANIIAVSSQMDGQFIVNLLRRGVKEFVPLPLQPEELLGAIDRLTPQLTRSSSDAGGAAIDPRRGARVIAVAGVRGGVGCTSLAVNLGCILAQDPNNRVAMLDFDMVMGDADVCLDIIPDYTLMDVVENIERIDMMWLRRALSKHSSGMHLLPHPVKIEDATAIHESHISRLLGLLKREFTHIFLDLSKSYQPTDFAAMEVADDILLIVQLDVSSLNNVIRLLQTLEQRPGLIEKVKVIANRVGSEGEITIQRAKDTIGREILHKIPNDSRTMFASRNNGVPLFKYAPKSAVFKAIQALADDLSGRGGPAHGGGSPNGAPDDPKKPNFFGMFRRE